MDDVQKRFGTNCKTLREQAKLTQDALGELSGLTGAYISEIERGNANPTLATVEKLAKGLNIHVSVLADFTEKELSEDEFRENLLREIAKSDKKTVKSLCSFVKLISRKPNG